MVGIEIGRKACSEISLLVHRLLRIKKTDSGGTTTVPQFLIGPFHGVIVGLARQPLVNSHARCPPLVWKMGWSPVPEGPLKTELPPLPIEILKEKDVLDEFVRRVNLIGKCRIDAVFPFVQFSSIAISTNFVLPWRFCNKIQFIQVPVSWCNV